MEVAIGCAVSLFIVIVVSCICWYSTLIEDRNYYRKRSQDYCKKYDRASKQRDDLIEKLHTIQDILD